MRWTLVAAVFGLVLVVGVIGVRLFREPRCPAGADAPVPVLVGKQLIPSGTTGEAIVRRHLATTVAVRCGESEGGSISDATFLAGQVATADLFPGQQLTDEDFSPR